MIRRAAIVTTSFLILLSLAFPLNTTAQNTSSPASQPSAGHQHHAGGPLRRLRRKIKRMRHQRRAVRRKAMFGHGSASGATNPNTAH